MTRLHEAFNAGNDYYPSDNNKKGLVIAAFAGCGKSWFGEFCPSALDLKIEEYKYFIVKDGEGFKREIERGAKEAYLKNGS